MQGVRQANPRLGEYVCVIGLGLLGQITAQILRANGCDVFGVDTAEPMVALAARVSCHVARTRSDAGLEVAFDAFTHGHGFDSVIITAATQSTDPVELATSILRHKGSMVIVGAVPMNVPREPHFYKKELDLKISCSYGPGRYDPVYEEFGQDYPYGHVRWTENRNMGAFIRLLAKGSVDVQPLITHVFDVEQATDAYKIIMGANPEPHMGILLRYPDAAKISPVPGISASPAGRPAAPGIGFIGAGSFAQKFLIPYARERADLISVVTSHGVTARSVGAKFQFRSHSTDAGDVLSTPRIGTVFIATRHDTHATFVKSALEAGKHVFVEKPLAIRHDEFAQVLATASNRSDCLLMVGYNRRFSPVARYARDVFARLPAPLLITCRVNAGFLPMDHWTQTEQGGGRILGEVCHFVDFLQFLAGSEPVSVHAVAVASDSRSMAGQDNLIISLRFQNGSIGQISYVASGAKSLAKERIEIFGGGQTLVIDDFKRCEEYAGNRRRNFKMPGKGHREEVVAFLDAVRNASPSPIPLRSLALTTATTFAIIDSLRTDLPQAVLLPPLGV
jgi:polar amino acid transport system substrate-binding protein